MNESQNVQNKKDLILLQNMNTLPHKMLSKLNEDLR